MIQLKTLDVSIISFIILSIILIHSYNRLERIFVQYRLFLTLVVLNMFLIFVDLASWGFNGNQGLPGYIGNVFFNTLLYICVPIIPAVWIIYIYYVVYQDLSFVKRLRIILVSALSVHAVIAVASVWTGWFFYVDSSNIYHRGPLFWLHLAYSLILMGYALIFLLLNRKHFERRYFYSMLGFFVAPVTGSLIQAFNYGVSYNWAGMSLALLIIYMNLQSKNLNTDFLTGVNNRLHLQKYLKMKIRNSTDRSTFGAIMLDIDKFKQINDKFGHGVGDEALKDSVRILRESLRRSDFIARFGGDEFLAIIDVSDYKLLEDAVERISLAVKRFNEEQNKPYKIGFSMGYDIYSTMEKMNEDEYLDHLDKLMYQAKNNKKKDNENYA